MKCNLIFCEIWVENIWLFFEVSALPSQRFGRTDNDLFAPRPGGQCPHLILLVFLASVWTCLTVAQCLNWSDALISTGCPPTSQPLLVFIWWILWNKLHASVSNDGDTSPGQAHLWWGVWVWVWTILKSKYVDKPHAITFS